jgi:hypothetical protein
MAALALAALAAFAFYRWQMRERARRIKAWVTDYLVARHGAPLIDLHINCSDDPLWPVLASCANPRTKARHSLRFSCAGAPSTSALASENEEPRQRPRGERADATESCEWADTPLSCYTTLLT